LPPESDEALRYAVLLARAYNAKLFLCHCAVAPVLATFPITVAAHGQGKKLLTDTLARYMDRVGSRKLNWEIVVVENEKGAGEEIVREACEQRVDLIVMRSRRSPVAALLGSTAEQVSRTAFCPVLVARPRGDEGDDEAEFQRVLVPHDFSSSSELALSYALSIAQKYRAELHLIHVLPEPQEDGPQIAWNETGVESAYHRAARRLQGSVPAEVYHWARVLHVVRWGKPYREVLAYAREQDVDLICMGALGRDFGLEALFGSNVDRVLRQASCPVLIARPLKLTTHASHELHIHGAH
jgi:nucleotide-binding universal stress UspA family protein